VVARSSHAAHTAFIKAPPAIPDRDTVPFSWYVTCGMPAYALLAGVRFDRIFTEADAIIEAFDKGEPHARALFGPDVRYSGPGWAAISYGHVNCLGAPLIFPEDSEVAMQPIHDSMDAGIVAFERPVNWAETGMMPFYLELWARLKKAYPDKAPPSSRFALQGPIPSPWNLSGHVFFTDPYEDEAKYAEYLRLLTQSIADYAGFMRRVNGQPTRSAEGVLMCDDISAFFNPVKWPDWILPWQDLYFSLQSDGPRHAHIEGMVPDHLHHLDTLGLAMFDPSVSPRLRATDLRDRCRVPFQWRLNSMQVRDFSVAQIRQYVLAGVADGASGVFLNLIRDTVTPDSVPKVHAFMAAAREVERRLHDGCPRHRLLD